MKLANPKLPSWQSTLTRIQSKAEINLDDEAKKIKGGNSLKWHPQAVYSQKKHKIAIKKAKLSVIAIVELRTQVTLEDNRDCDVPVSTIFVFDNHSEIFSDSKIDDDISVYDDDFEDIEYVEALLSDLEIVNQEEENVVQQEEGEVDLEDISQIQDIVLREKLLSISRPIANIESLNDNSTLDRVLNSFESDNYLSVNFSPEFETFCDYTEETRSGNTTHVDDSLPEYDSFCFEIEPDQERLINDILDDSSNDHRFWIL
nr:hypothetical protein [Tanacetum cinerariifolium]